MPEKAPNAITLPSRVAVGEVVTLSGHEIGEPRQGRYFCFEAYGDPTPQDRSAVVEIERIGPAEIRFTVPLLPSNNSYRFETRNDIGDRVYLGTVHVD